MTPSKASILRLLTAAGFFALTAGAQVLPLSSKTPRSRIKADGSNLFEVLAGRFDAVRFKGVRSFSLLHDKHIYRYTELVQVDPSRTPARFSQALVAEVVKEGSNRNAPPPVDLLRKKAFGLRVGFLHLYRDFRVFDAALARKNYVVQPMGAISKLGRVMRVFDILPRSPERAAFRILVDVQYDLVLDQVKFAPGGILESMLVYNALEIGPSVRFEKGTKWWSPWMKVRDHADLDHAKKDLDFPPLLPDRKTLEGFRLHQVRTTQQPIQNKTWLVLHYTNGIENRFLLESRRGVQAVSVPSGPPSSRETIVMRYRLGPATQLFASYKHADVLFVGSVYGKRIPEIFRGLLTH